MEINKSGGGAILFGIIKQNNMENFSGYMFGNTFKTGSSNHLELSISKHGLIDINVNGKIVSKGFLEAPFELSLIKVGKDGNRKDISTVKSRILISVHLLQKSHMVYVAVKNSSGTCSICIN